MHSSLDSFPWKSLWKLRLNDRLKLFLWKIAWDIIPSKARLHAIFPISSNDMACPLCNLAVDSLSHLFFSCSFARIAWRFSFWPLDSSSWSHLSLDNWIKGILNPALNFGIPFKDSHLFQIYAAVLCDLLWFHRNKAAHEGIIPDILGVAGSIKKITLEHYAAWQSLTAPVPEKWEPPKPGSFKVNFDTAIRDSFSVQAAVCRDSTGKIIKAISQFNPTCDPTFGEALAARLAASLAVSLSLPVFILEGDSLSVILALQSPLLSKDWKIADLISDTLSLLPVSSIWKASKVNRSANFCAHYVAFWAAARPYSGCIPNFFSPLSSIPICSGKDPPPPVFSFSM
ncbi:hypothetical protein SLA2020_263250 [Shorea laevis]